MFRLKNGLFILIAMLSVTIIKAQVMDYVLSSEFNISINSNGYAPIASQEKVAHNTDYGVKIMNRADSGELSNYAHLKLPFIKQVSVNDNYLAVTEKNDNNSNNLILFDITGETPNEINRVDNINLNDMILLDNYIVYSTIENTFLLSIENLELLDSYPNVVLSGERKVSGNKILTSCSEDNTSLMLEINEAGEFVLLFTLPEIVRPVSLQDNLFIGRRNSREIVFYDVSEEPTYIANYQQSDETIIIHDYYVHNNQLGFVCSPGSSNDILFRVLDITELNNITLLDEFNFSTITNPNEIMFVPYFSVDCIDNDVYVAMIHQPLIHLEIEDSGIINYIGKQEGYRKTTWNNVVFENRNYTTDVLDVVIHDLSNPNMPVEIANNYERGTYKWFAGDELHCTIKKPGTEYLYCYEKDNSDNLVLIDSIYYGFDNEVAAFHWDGDFLVMADVNEYSIKGFKLEDGAFVEKWSEVVSSLMKGIGVKDNHIYIGSNVNSFIYIYEFDEESISEVNLVNTFTPYFYAIEFSDDIMSLHGHGAQEGAVFDMSEDPTEINNPLDLDITTLSCAAEKKRDYIFYTGENNNRVVPGNGLFVYKKINAEYQYIDSIPLGYEIMNIDIIDGDNQEDFTIILYSRACSMIYQAHITANGDLEIEPITTNLHNYPNPFNPETTISYVLSKASDVEIDIYNLKGQKVKSLIKDYQQEGNHKVAWNGNNDLGNQVSSGVYFSKIKTENEVITRKMTLVK